MSIESANQQHPVERPRIPPRQWAIVGSWVTVQLPSIRRPLHGRVCELDGAAIAVETELGILRVRACDCRPVQTPKGSVH